MQYGALMGGYAVAAEVCFVLGLKMAPLMNVQSLLTLAYPLVVLLVAFRFRKQVSEGFPYSFGRGFFFTLLVVLYSGVWAALVALLYLQLFDHGYLFQTYLELLNRPEMVKTMQQSGLTAYNTSLYRGTDSDASRRTLTANTGFCLCCHHSLRIHAHCPHLFTHFGPLHDAW